MEENDFLERTYRNLIGPLTLALSPRHFPVFTRARNPNRLVGTRTGLTLQALRPYGAVDVPLWHHDDVPHSRSGYAMRAPSSRDVWTAVAALRRCFQELSPEWEAFLASDRRFVAAGLSQLKPLEAFPEIRVRLKESFTFHPSKWITKPLGAFPAVERAVAAAGNSLALCAFQTLVEVSASMSALESALDFYANETEEHRRARIAKIKLAIEQEEGEKRARRLQNLDASLKTPERQAEIKAKYRFTVGARTRATILALRQKRFQLQALETAEQQFERRERHLAHIRNVRAAHERRTPEQKAQTSAKRRATWRTLRPILRARKCQKLVAGFAAMDACTRGYHYDRLLRIKGADAVRKDPFGEVLMAFYDSHPGQLETDAKQWKADATRKLKEKGYRSQKAYQERGRVKKWGAEHATMTRGEKLKIAYAKNREVKEREAKEAEDARVAAGGEPTPPKEKWRTQRLYRERKAQERAARARGEEVAALEGPLAERGKKIAAAWAKKRAAKELEKEAAKAAAAEKRASTGSASASSAPAA